MSALKNFRTMTGPERRSACRAHLEKQHGVNFHGDVHAVGISGLTACAEMAKAICWRKSQTSSMSLGAAFFVYLSRDVVREKHAAAVSAPSHGHGCESRRASGKFNFNYGKGASA